ncbi:EamA family transporter [Dyadobacter sp. NIV53]|uniref:EamA family transporter n=1 Tax=Dyadobacter sp. NIV53 TaxID=2861765 RepID=UPI001C8864C3|nr:EamA family transporter [Dyadobacter sp. NIV53]
MVQVETIPQWKVTMAFIAIYIVWGTTYLAIAYTLQGFPPFVLSAFRFFIAGILLFTYCKIKGYKVPPLDIVVPSAISGTVALVGGSGLVTWAEQYIGSGMQQQ